MKRLAFSCIAFLALLFVGCNVQQEYVKADKATYDVIAPDYLKYVEADANLTDDQKQSKKDTVATWRLRIDKNTKDD